MQDGGDVTYAPQRVRHAAPIRRPRTGHRHEALAGLVVRHIDREELMIRKLKSGEYRLYSRKKDPKTGKRRNLGTFKTRAAAEKHEKAVQFFKHGG